MERKRTRNSSEPAAVYQLSARRSGCDVPRGRARGSPRLRHLSAIPPEGHKGVRGCGANSVIPPDRHEGVRGWT